MSPLEIIKLVGFATGAALHLYLAWLIWNRRLGTQQKLTQHEWSFIVIGVCLGGWFLGNLLTTLHALLFGFSRLTGWLRVWDTITTISVSMVPSAILFAHIAFWSYLDDHRTLTPRQVRLAGLACYGLMIFMPYPIYRIATGPYKPFFEKLKWLLIPYSIWYLLALSASAVIAWSMKDKLAAESARERRFFKQLAVLLLITGVFEFVVVGVRRSGPSDTFWVAYLLLSLLPAFFISYYVYRYKLVEVIIKGSLVYASFAVVFIAFYTYVVRRIDSFMAESFKLERPGVIEAILILGMFALAGPLMRVLDRIVQRLFTQEIGLYRDVVRQVTVGAAGFGELDSLIRYVEGTIRRGLDLKSVRIIPAEQIASDSPERRLADRMVEQKIDMIESDEDLSRIQATAAYALSREDELIGLMLIAADQRTLTSEKGEVLKVLAGQIAIEIESCRLVEDKVQLERELASRERLATLGQMAATVAHEVKNPLSSIKSIAQVMREEESLSEYDRDLELIVSEVDRLSRTVSQLLAFSRPGVADSRPAELSDLINSIVDLFSKEARERGVLLAVDSSYDITLNGAQSAALREALGNLVLNAVQASEQGDKVTILAEIENSQTATDSSDKNESVESLNDSARLVISITDTGPGISEAERSRIFEPFYTTKSRGTGLGLAIVQRRVSDIGGDIELTSPVAEGHGTRFKLTLPVVRSEKVASRLS